MPIDLLENISIKEERQPIDLLADNNRPVDLLANIQNKPVIDLLATNQPRDLIADNQFVPFTKRTSFLNEVTRPFVVHYEKAAEAFNSGIGGFTQRLGDIVNYASSKVGISHNDLLDKIAKNYMDNAEYWNKKAEKNGVRVIDEIVGSAVGGAIPGIAEFMLNVPYAAIGGAAEAQKEGKNEVVGAIHAGLKRSILGMAFNAGNQLKQPLSAITNAGIFGVQTATEGGSKEDIAKNMAVGALYSLGGKGNLGIKEIVELNRRPIRVTKQPIPVTPETQGNALIPKVNDRLDMLNSLREEISQGTAGRRYVTRGEEGEVTRAGYEPSTFPEYFKNQGFTKENTLNIIDKAIKGEKLTSKQQDILKVLTIGRKNETLFNQAQEIYYKVVEEKQPLLDNFGKSIAKINNAEYKGVPKSIESMIEKVNRKTSDYDIYSMNDHARGSIITSDYSKWPEVINQLKEAGFRIENSLNQPLNKFGYSGINAVRSVGDKINGEMQVHTNKTWDIKTNYSDAIYRHWRQYEKNSQLNIPKELRKEFVRDMRKSREVWASVVAEIPQAIKDKILVSSASETGTESVIAPSMPKNTSQVLPPSSEIVAGSPFSIGKVSSKRPSESLENLKEKLSIMASKESMPQGKGVVKEKETSSERYAKEQIAKREEARRGERGNITQEIYREAKKKLVDFAAPIEDTLRIAQKKGEYKVLPKYDITNQIDRVLRAPTIAGQFARDNGLVDVIKKVDNLNNLDQYLIAKHVQTVEAKGIKTGRDLVKDTQLIKDFAPKYEKDAKIVTAYSHKILDYAVDSGLISKDLADTLKVRYPDYVPIKRVFNELERVGGIGTKAIASLSKQTVVQKLVGSEREIENPLASLLEKTNDVFKQGEKNKAARILASYKDLPGNPFQLKELKEGEIAPYTISYLENGVKRTFETTPDISQAAKSLNVQHLNILGKIFALPVRIARIGITGINLPFLAANIVKDQVTAIINSKNALKTSVANPAVFTKSLMEAVGHGKVYEEMAREGTLGTSFDISRNQPELALEKIRSGRNIQSKIKYTVRHPGELLRAVENTVNRGEEFTRIQQYKGTKEALLKQGVIEADARIGAAKASRENTVNFARRGEWGTVLNSTFLYINANIQGTRTFVRNFSERPISTAGKMALVVFTPVALTTAWNLADEKRKKVYEDISEYEKQNNIIIIPYNPTQNKDGTWDVIKIPLSQEINNIASMARRPIEAAYKLEPMVAKDIVQAFVGTISPINPATGSFASTLTPQAIKPSMEALTNRNLFTGIPQVPAKMEKLSPELQVKPYTSGTARKIGAALKASPIKVEEFIRGTVGGVGAQILNVSDRILAGMDIIPKDQIGGQSVVKAILARFSKARGGHLDDAANKKLEDILRRQADAKFRLNQTAEILYADLKKYPPQQANIEAKRIKGYNPALFAELKKVAEAERLNLDYNDRLIMQLQVTNGERAKFIWTNIKSLNTNEEKNAYINGLRKKKIISDNVMQQLKILKKRNY